MTKSLQKVSINSPQSMATFANTLKEFIVTKKLYSEIKNKNYVNVEGWEFAGASMGINAIVTDTKDLSKDSEIKYMATVELRLMSSGKLIGSGVALCSNKEDRKKSFDEYSILSMAQTRAIGKAYRNSFAWLMKMAGYEATPAEEMTEEDDANQTQTVEPITIVLRPIDEIIAETKAVLDTLPTPDRLRAFKEVRKMNEKSLTEYDWRTLHANLVKAESDEV